MSLPDYIKVNSINDIDPNKLSLNYVGKKFIDKDNNRFSVRFNRETRKMEIVKILIKQGGKIQEDVALRRWESTKEINTKNIEKDKPVAPQPPPAPKKSESEATIENEKSISQNSIESPKKDSNWNFSGYDMDINSEESIAHEKNLQSTSSPSNSLPSEEGRSETKEEDSSIDTFRTPTPTKVDGDKWKDKNEKDKIDQLMKRIEEAKQRINSVLINIKSSRIFEVTGDPSENQNIVGNLTREFDVEVFQGLDEVSNYLKELTSYPRAISYYTAKYEKSKKPELTRAESEKEKLHLIIRWEMQDAFTKILQKTKALTLSLLNVLNLKNENHIKQLQYQNQLMFTDAKNATIYCSQDLDKLIQEVENWKYETMETNDGT